MTVPIIIDLYLSYLYLYSIKLDFWLGLENMHKLTSEAKTLIIELWYNNEEYAIAEYSGFQIGDSASFYPLSFTSFVGAMLAMDSNNIME